MNREWLDLDSKSDQFDDQRLNIAVLFNKYMEEQNKDVEKAMESLTGFLEAREKVINQFIEDTQKKLDAEDTSLEVKLNASYDIHAAKLLLNEIQAIYRELAESVSDDNKILIDIEKVSNKISKQTNDALKQFEGSLEFIRHSLVDIQHLESKHFLSPATYSVEDRGHLLDKKNKLRDYINTPERKGIAKLLQNLIQDEYKQYSDQYSDLAKVCDLAIARADRNKSKPTIDLAQGMRRDNHIIDRYKKILLEQQQILNGKLDGGSIDISNITRQEIIHAALEKIESTNKIISDPRSSKEIKSDAGVSANKLFKQSPT